VSSIASILFDSTIDVLHKYATWFLHYCPPYSRMPNFILLFLTQFVVMFPHPYLRFSRIPYITCLLAFHLDDVVSFKNCNLWSTAFFIPWCFHLDLFIIKFHNSSISMSNSAFFFLFPSYGLSIVVSNSLDSIHLISLGP
jgi:hypothetical protein